MEDQAPIAEAPVSAPMSPPPMSAPEVDEANLKDFVRPPAQQKEMTHPLLARPCREIGRNSSFEARPAVVHFNGFQVGRTVTKKIDFVNISTTAQRCNVMPPSTPQFHLRVQPKKGRVAPGLAEQVKIDFTPDAWRYYSDAVRVYCGNETLLVPIHAYPVMEALEIPRRLDFGDLAVGDDAVKSFSLVNNVPVEFEYRLHLDEAQKSFALVEPTSEFGVIPPEGTVTISIRYTPQLQGTALGRLHFEVSQFDAEPRIIDLAGNCVPGKLRERLLDEAAKKFETEYPGIDHAKNIRRYDNSALMPKTKPKNYDVVDSRKFLEKTVKRQPPEPETEEIRDGIRIPKDMKTQRDVNDVLMQDPTKEKKPMKRRQQKDDKKKEEKPPPPRKQEAPTFEEMMWEVEAPLRALEKDGFADDPVSKKKRRQAKEAAFLKELASAEIKLEYLSSAT